MIISCKTCGKLINKNATMVRKFGGNGYCNRICFGYSKRVSKVERICEFCSEKFLAYPSQVKFSGARFCSSRCKDTFNRGENHFRFKDASSEAEKLRKSPAYRNWRTTVFIRDNRSCVLCGSKRDIEADHIKPRSLFPELTLEIDNGRTLCHECHTKTPSYMNGWMKREDFI